VDVQTTIKNTAEDHRMRLLIPTDLAADAADSAGHFNVDRRPNIPVRDERGEYWPEMQTVPMGMFVDVPGGLAVVSDSFTEYQLLEDSRRTLALTLFRAVRARICTEYRSTGSFPHQKGAQLLQSLEYRYAIYPHGGDWKDGGVYEEAATFNTPPVSFQFSAGKGTELPAGAELLRVEPVALVVSAVKMAEDRESLIVRVFNPTQEPVSGTVKLFKKPSEAWLVNLDEVRGKSVTVMKNGVRLTVAPGRIESVEIKF
jgi:mannosylglycerate hydrolase